MRKRPCQEKKKIRVRNHNRCTLKGSSEVMPVSVAPPLAIRHVKKGRYISVTMLDTFGGKLVQ
jgi:hypothetical protein